MCVKWIMALYKYLFWDIMVTLNYPAGSTNELFMRDVCQERRSCSSNSKYVWRLLSLGEGHYTREQSCKVLSIWRLEACHTVTSRQVEQLHSRSRKGTNWKVCRRKRGNKGCYALSRSSWTVNPRCALN